jgi:hypothetical protein
MLAMEGGIMMRIFNSFYIPLWPDLEFQTVHCSGLYGFIALSHDCFVFEFGSFLAYSKTCQLAGVPFCRLIKACAVSQSSVLDGGWSQNKNCSHYFVKKFDVQASLP